MSDCWALILVTIDFHGKFSLFFFICGCLVVQYHLLEKTIVSPLFLCQKSVDYVGLFPGSLFSSADLFVSSLTNTTLFDYCSFTVSLKVR